MRDYSDYIFKKPTPKQDDRPWWQRLLSSIRPTISIKGKVNPRDGSNKTNITIGVKGGFDF